MRTYWVRLGHFISIFSEVEEHLNNVVWHYADLQYKQAVMLFSALRVDHATNLINRIILAENRSGPMVTEITLVLDQLGKIARARNDIVHLGIGETRGAEFIITNKRYAHTESRIREMPVTIPILDAMIQDLYRISSILDDHIHFDLKEPGKEYVPKTAISWRYKPPSQSSRDQQRQESLPRRKRPQRSSRE
jgi:hypothetical protein